MKTVALGDVAQWGSGGTPTRSVAAYFGEGTPWLSIADLNDDVVHDAKESLTSLGIASSAAKVVPAGTILIAMYGSIGKLGIAGREMCTSQAIAFAIPNEIVDHRYLFHYLLAQRQLLQARGRGGTQMNIGQADLKTWPIPLPPLDEQRRIVAILDQADALRAKRRQLLAHLDALTQSIFHDMFEERDELILLGDVCKRVTDGTHQSPSWENDGIPFLFVSNITSGEIDTNTQRFISEETWGELTRRTPIEVGDVLYSTVGSYGIPVVVRTSERFAFQRHIAHIKPACDRIMPEFLATQLASPKLKRQATSAARGIAQPTVNLADIRKFKIAVPPIVIQQKFVDHVERIRAHRALIQRALTADDKLFASLQARAFRGEL